jgi:hypothetical protein
MSERITDMYARMEAERNALAVELERVTEALREARPYVYGVAHEASPWRSATAVDVLGRVDGALAGGARAAQEDKLPPCDCRANDWVEGDNNTVRCVQCGGYAGEPGTSIRVVPVQEGRVVDK